MSIFLPRTRVDPRLMYLSSDEGKAKLEARLMETPHPTKREFAEAQSEVWLGESAEVRERYQAEAARRREEMEGNRIESAEYVVTCGAYYGLTNLLVRLQEGLLDSVHAEIGKLLGDGPGRLGSEFSCDVRVSYLDAERCIVIDE